jgi:hypothetical protein
MARRYPIGVAGPGYPSINGARGKSAGPTEPAETAPGQVTGLGATPGTERVSLTWSTPASDGGSAITGYKIEGNHEGSGWANIVADTGSTSTGYIHLGLTDGDEWAYRVSAINAIGTGTASATVTETVGAVYDFFVDAVGGLDSNNGLTLGTAKQTITAAQALMTTAGQSLGLVRGSTWLESVVLPVDDATVGVVGPGSAMAVLDGMDVVTGWTQPDAVTYPQVWAKAWTKPRAGGSDYTIYVIAEAGGEDTLCSYLVATVAEVQTLARRDAYHTTSFSGSTSFTVSIWSDVDPNSDGRTRKLPKRHQGIDMSTNAPIDAAPLPVGASPSVVGPLEIKNFHGHYGGLSTDEGAVMRQLYVRNGGLHHIVSASSIVDTVVDGALDKSLGQFGWTDVYPWVTYLQAGDGSQNFHHKRVLVDCPTPATPSYSNVGLVGVYSHTSGGALGDMIYEQCAIRNAFRGMNRGNAGSFTELRGCYLEGGSTAFLHSVTESRYKHCLLREQRGTVHQMPAATVGDYVIENEVIYDSVGTTNAPRIGGTVNGDVTIRNCIIFTDRDFTVDTVLGTFSDITGGTINLLVENCVFVIRGGLNSTTTFWRSVAIGGATFSAIFRNNVYFHRTNHFTFSWRGTNGAQHTGGSPTGNHWATWQGTLGFDTTSLRVVQSDWALLLSTYFMGTPSAGDFRLKPSVAALPGGGDIATNCGPQEHWDWNQRQVVAGAPERWPVLPATIAEKRSYVQLPEAWDFYP